MTGAHRTTAAPHNPPDRAYLHWYLLLEAALLLAIQICKARGVVGPAMNALMYSTIAVNTVVVLAWGCTCPAGLASHRTWALAAGLLVTALADVCLTLLAIDRLILPGVLLFCAVQTLYAVYLGLTARALLARLLACAVTLLLPAVLGQPSLLAAAGTLDIALLLCNVVQAWCQPNARAFALGLTLFLACDLCVGLDALALGTTSTAASFLVWLFYAPAQVLITLTFVREVEAAAR